MTLERPLLALVVGVLAIAVLYVLDRLRRRPVVLLVASLQLFPEAAETETETETTKKRAWRDLVLKCLAALALALGAGGPELAQARSVGRRVSVLLDRSASMDAREAGGTRLDLAREELRRALAELASEDEVELHLDPAGEDEPRRLSPKEARDFPVEIVRAPRSEDRTGLVAAAASRKELPLLVVTDRELAPVASELEAWREVALVGSPLKNRGITALASRREKLLVATSEPATVELRFGASTVTLAVSGSAIAPVPSGTERVEARIVGEDALATDDRAIALRATDAPLRVALDPDLGAALETALRAIPGIETHSATHDETTGNDVYFWRAPAEGDPRSPDGYAVYFEVGTGKAAPRLRGTKLACELDGANVSLGGVAASPPRDLEPILHDAAGHVLAARGTRTLWIGFDPFSEPRKDWAVSFVRFLAYVLEDVRALVPEDLVVHPTGRPLVLPRPAKAAPGAPLVVTDPRGRTRSSTTGVYVPLEPGIHEVRSGAEKVLFSAALLDPATQDLSGARARPFSPALLGRLGARQRTREALPLAWLAVLAGLGLALLAWSLENR